MTRSTIAAAITTELALPGNATVSDGDDFTVRLYVPVDSHSVTFSETPIEIPAPLNKPKGIFPEPAHTGGHADGEVDADTTFDWDTSTQSLPPSNTTDNRVDQGFRNTAFAYGRYDLNISMKGTVQRVEVDNGSNEGAILPTDATDATGKVLNEQSSGSFVHTEYEKNSTTVGMTGDQLRNEILRLAARQHEFGLQEDGTDNPNLYYMYPNWRGQDNPHFFRGIITNFSVNDEVGMREGYDFNLTWKIANPRPSQ